MNAQAYYVHYREIAIFTQKMFDRKCLYISSVQHNVLTGNIMNLSLIKVTSYKMVSLK